MKSPWRQKMSFIITGVTVFASQLSLSQAYLDTELEFRKPILSDAIKNIKEVHLHLMNDPNTNKQMVANKENLLKVFGIDESLVQNKIGKDVVWEVLSDELKLADESVNQKNNSYLFVLSNHLDKSSKAPKETSFSFKKASNDFLKTTQKVLDAKYLLKLLNLDSTEVNHVNQNKGLWASKKTLQFEFSSKVKTIGELKRSIAGGVIAVIKYQPNVKDVDREEDKKNIKPVDKVSSL